MELHHPDVYCVCELHPGIRPSWCLCPPLGPGVFSREADLNGLPLERFWFLSMRPALRHGGFEPPGSPIMRITRLRHLPLIGCREGDLNTLLWRRRSSTRFLPRHFIS